MKTTFFVLTFILIVSAVTSAKSADTNTVSSTVVTSTPGTASAPSVVVNNSDVCKTGASTAVQTQVFGIASGVTIRDETCELLKLSRALYVQGMKVASISLLTQDARVWDSMWNAGTYAPINGKIGMEARDEWLDNVHLIPNGSVVKANLLKEKKIEERKESNNNEFERFVFYAMAMYIGIPILF
tara:strand:- start:2596 stop:3150 length:555 start_codon:yes stop_codon:yes gene_type:complete